MKPLTLQTRIALWSALVIALGMVLCGAAITLVAYHEEVGEFDRQLLAEANRVFDEWERHGGAATYPLQPNATEIRKWLPASELPRLVEIADVNGVVIFRSESLVHDALRGQPPGIRTLTIDGRRWRIAVSAKDGIVLRIAADLAPVEELMKKLIWAFVFALPVLLTFITFSARWVARNALDPVRRMTAFAERITAEHLDERVPVPLARDEIQRLAMVLNDTFERLKKSFQQARRFSADASHELKTPLTVLRAGIETLMESPTLDPRDQEAMAGLLEQTRRLSSITDSLLLLSRADAGRLQLDFAPTDVSEIIEACVEDARIIAEEDDIQIATEVPRSLCATVDRDRLSQIVVNLLDNAVKYNEPGGRIRVDARHGRDVIEVTVGNTGPVIPAEHAQHIFERFFRVESATEASGHGLGLSLARELARAHGGDVVLGRSENAWTEFRVTLPATGPNAALHAGIQASRR